MFACFIFFQLCFLLIFLVLNFYCIASKKWIRSWLLTPTSPEYGQSDCTAYRLAFPNLSASRSPEISILFRPLYSIDQKSSIEPCLCYVEFFFMIRPNSMSFPKNLTMQNTVYFQRLLLIPFRYCSHFLQRIYIYIYIVNERNQVKLIYGIASFDHRIFPMTFIGKTNFHYISCQPTSFQHTQYALQSICV